MPGSFFNGVTQMDAKDQLQNYLWKNHRFRFSDINKKEVAERFSITHQYLGEILNNLESSGKIEVQKYRDFGREFHTKIMYIGDL